MTLLGLDDQYHKLYVGITLKTEKITSEKSFLNGL